MSATHPDPHSNASELRRYRWFVLGVIAVAVVLRWPTTSVGLMRDDFMQWAMLAGRYPGDGYVPFDLYAFLRPGQLDMYVDAGVAPWWSVGELHGTVLRPLPSLLTTLDDTLAPGRVRLWHVHSLVWFAAMLASAAAVLRRLLPGPIAVVALGLIACDSSMISPLSWLANRCVLVCATFGFAAFAVHIARRSPTSTMGRRAAWLEGFLMTACMASGEYALAMVAYFAMFELFAAGGWRERVVAMLPSVIPMVGYLVAHAAGGYGTFGAEGYADPFEAPLDWASWAWIRVPELLASAVWSMPAATSQLSHHLAFAGWFDGESASFAATWHLRLAWVAIGLTLVTAALIRPGLQPHERRTLTMLALGGVLGLFVVSVAPAHDRLLVVGQLAACAGLAGVGVGAARLALERTSESPGRVARWLPLPIAILALTMAGPVDLAWGQRQTEQVRELERANVAALTKGDLLSAPLAGRDVVVLNTTSPSIGLYGQYMVAVHGGEVANSWRSLAMGEFAAFASRPESAVLELTAIQAAWLRTPGELFFRRADQPVHAGDVFEVRQLRVDVIADDSGAPTRVRFTFPASLDDPRYVFLISTREGLVPWVVPRVGKTGIVPLPTLPVVVDPSG